MTGAAASLMTSILAWDFKRPGLPGAAIHTPVRISFAVQYGTVLLVQYGTAGTLCYCSHPQTGACTACCYVVSLTLQEV